MKIYNSKEPTCKNVLSLKQYPNVNKDLIFGYNYQDYSDKGVLVRDIINKIVDVDK